MNANDIDVVWSLDEVAAAIAAMPAIGPLPTRTVLVPSARLGRALQQILADTRPSLLAGTRFVTAPVLAEAIVHGAGLRVTSDEGALREHRISQLVAEGLDPPGFGNALLRETTGWAAAFAATISDLERAGLRPRDLPTDEPSIAGTRAVWEAANTAAGPSWTHARMIAAAARRLADGRAVRRESGPVLALVALDADRVVVEFFHALPATRMLVLAARPLRAHVVERAVGVFGSAIRERLLLAPHARSARDLDIAASQLFEREASDREARLRAGATPDGSLALEAYDGVAAEVDAAADWVVRQVLAGIPLHRIAVLAPAADPWCTLLASALRAIEWGTEPPPLEIAEGLPGSEAIEIVRVLALLRGLAHGLGVDALVEILGGVRATDGRTPSRSRILELAPVLGALDRTSASPAGDAAPWRSRLDAAEEQLSAPPTSPGFADQAEYVARRRAQQLATLRALRPALEGVFQLHERIRADDPLPSLATAIADFIRDHHRLASGGPPVPILLAERLAPLVADTTCSRIRGAAALRVIETEVRELRILDEPHAGAAIHVGSLASAAGLEFDAVRIIGLCEGSIPPTVRGDPVLPDEQRERISPTLATSRDRVVSALHHLDLVVRGTRRCLAVSAPRLAVDRTVREPSSFFVELGAALRREGLEAAVPSLESLRRTEFVPALAQRERERLQRPCRRTDWLLRLAEGHHDLPSAWRDAPALDLRVLLGSRNAADKWCADDAVLAPSASADPEDLRTGLEPSRPTSAWRLDTLLRCPRRYLYEHVLRWKEPARIPPGHELDPMAFGELVHVVAERFFGEHGTAFMRHDGTLEQWRGIIRGLAAHALDERVGPHGLDTPRARESTQRKLATHVDRLLESSWARGPRRFVATEWAFGVETPLCIPVEGGDLFVRGRIDLVEATDRQAIVTDIKTGRCRPRRGSDEHARVDVDLQIGIYAQVVAQRCAALEVAPDVGATYLHTDDSRGTHRGFEGEDTTVLRRRTLEWLETARGLLEARAFPRTPDRSDCSHCPFSAVCASPERVHGTNQSTARHPAVRRFLAMKETR